MFKNGIKLRKRSSSRSKKALSCHEGQLSEWKSMVTDADDENEKFQSTATLTRNSNTNLNRTTIDNDKQLIRKFGKFSRNFDSTIDIREHKQKTETLPRPLTSSLNRNSSTFNNRYTQSTHTLPRKLNSTHIDSDEGYKQRDNVKVRFNEDSIKPENNRTNLSSSMSCIIVRKKQGDIQQALANLRNTVNSPTFTDQMSPNDNSICQNNHTNSISRSSSKLNGKNHVKMRKSNRIKDAFITKSVDDDQFCSLPNTKSSDNDEEDNNIKVNIKIKRAYSTLNTASIPNNIPNSSPPFILNSMTSPISPSGQPNFRLSQINTLQPKISFKSAVDGPVPYINYSRPNIILRSRLKRCPDH